MKERKNKGVAGRVLRVLAGVLCAAALSAVVYLGSILLQPQEDAEDFSVQDTEAVTRLQAGDFTDLRMLRDTFGAMLPALPDCSMEGVARNMEYQGSAVRYAQMRFESGAELTAVRPAFASPLLLKKDLIPSLNTDIRVLRTPAMLAGKGEQHCLYFEYDGAAYAFYAEGMTEDDFLTLAGTLEKIP